MTQIRNLMNAEAPVSRALPFGTAFTNGTTRVALFDRQHRMSYSAPNGLRLWTEHNKVQDFPGPVVAQMNDRCMVTIANMEGTHLAVFEAAEIFALTPADECIEVARLALSSVFSNRVYH